MSDSRWMDCTTKHLTVSSSFDRDAQGLFADVSPYCSAPGSIPGSGLGGV